jgi:hypothetical protein
MDDIDNMLRDCDNWAHVWDLIVLGLLSPSRVLRIAREHPEFMEWAESLPQEMSRRTVH